MVLWEAFADASRFEPICNGISSGSRDWLRVAVLLHPVSDAGASESLDDCVAHALPKAPARVLSLATQGFRLRDICLPALIEAEPGVARPQIEAAERALRPSLRAALEPARKECLALARSALKALRERGE
jgi:hypothetical protein